MRALDEILCEVRGRVEAACGRVGRDASEVGIIAVTKTHGPETVNEALAAGLTTLGENKVQEAMWKKESCPRGADWHLIGHLQSNKVRHALETFDFIHSVDSVKLLEKISSVAASLGREAHILLEVNVSGEKSKSGMTCEELPLVVERALSLDRIWLEGLMTMAPFSENPEDSRPCFRRLRELRDEMQDRFRIDLPRLSMGMSGDYEVAVEEGATWLRLGTVLFGERPKLKTVRAAGGEDVSSAGALDSYSGEGPTYKIMD